MTSILSFLRNKEINSENNNLDTINTSNQIEEFSKIKNISLAKAAERLNAFQSLHIEDAINPMTSPIINQNGDDGLKFKGDGSIIFKESGRWNGLTLGDSELWIEGRFKKGHIVSVDTHKNSENNNNHTSYDLESEIVKEVANKSKLRLRP